MAITLADFNKIWASTSPLTPYSFSESNYKQGWNFIGSTPPARQMWDYIQKNNDEKMQYLANNYLPLSGGTMTGTITSNTSSILKRSVDTDFLRIMGGSELATGASITLMGLERSTQPGEFVIRAKGASTNNDLNGKPDGSLLWSGKNVERVNASGTNYIRYESGLQICWGEMSVPGAAVSDETITLPQSFKDNTYMIAVGRFWAYSKDENYAVKSKSTTLFTWSTIGTVTSNSHSYEYIAIGFWK